MQNTQGQAPCFDPPQDDGRSMEPCVARQSDVSGEALAKTEARAISIYPRHYVCLLRSDANPTQTSVGYTTDLRARMRDHNSGRSIHTSKFAPWTLVTYFAFSEKRTASPSRNA